MKRLLIPSLILLTLSSLAHADVKPFVHPGMLQSRSDLDLMKQKVLAGEQPWKGAWDRLLAKKTSSLDFHPQPSAHVIRGAYGKPSIGSNELMASADAAYSHALQWYVTRDKAHAEKVFEIIDAWGPVLHDFQLNDAKLLAGWTGHQFLNAAEIVRYSDSGWSDKETENLRRMMLGVYYPLIKDFFPDANGNWDAAIMDTMLCMGVFFDDHAIFDRAVDHYLRGHLNGGITHYVYPSGQCQETTRDQGHVQLGLGEMAQACQIAWTQGVDLYGAADNRLALGFEYTAKFNLGNDVPCEGIAAGIARNKLSDIYYLVYQHYHFDRGMDLPYTQQAAEKTLPRSQSVLTLYRGPRDGASVPKQGTPMPSFLAAASGAVSSATAKPPTDAIHVHPGQQIQPELDRAAISNKWIVLEPGVYQLPAALRIPSGTKLIGQGRDTVLWLDPKVTGPAIINADSSTSNVVIRDLVIEGAVKTTPTTDPNSDRRTRSRPGAPDRAGILVDSGAVHALHGIGLVHVTVRNCTLTGLRIAGASDIALYLCSFTDNGNRVADGVSTNNVELDHVSQCRVIDCRLNNSPTGLGALISNSQEITFKTNEIARNAGYGIRFDHTRDITVQHNLVEGNEAGGIVADATCARMVVEANTLQNCGGSSIEFPKIDRLSVTDNVLRENHSDFAK